MKKIRLDFRYPLMVFSVSFALSLFDMAALATDGPAGKHGEAGPNYTSSSATQGARNVADIRDEIRELMKTYRDSRVPERPKPGGDPDWDYLPWNFKTQSWTESNRYGEAVVFISSPPGGTSETTVTAVTPYGAYVYRLPNGWFGRGFSGNFSIDVPGPGRINLSMEKGKDEKGNSIYYLMSPSGEVTEKGKLAVSYPSEKNPYAVSILRDAIQKMRGQVNGGLRRAIDIDNHPGGLFPKSYQPSGPTFY